MTRIARLQYKPANGKDGTTNKKKEKKKNSERNSNNKNNANYT